MSPSFTTLPVVLVRLEGAAALRRRELVALLRRAAAALLAAQAAIHHHAGGRLHPLLGLVAVLKRLHAPARPPNAVVAAIHEAAAESRAAALAAHAAAAAASHAHSDPLAFYEVAAVVLPLLFIALIYLVRLLEQRLAEDGQSFRDYFLFASCWRYVAAPLLVIGGASEILALRVLLKGPPAADWERDLVATGLVLVGTIALLAPILTLSQMFLRQANSWSAPRLLSAIEIGSVLVWVALAVVVLARVWGAS